jgi:hypothetical protein
MFLRDELLMGFWAADILYHLYLIALLIKDPCLTSPHAGHLPDPQFVPLDFRNSSNNVTWRPDFLVCTGVLSSLCPRMKIISPLEAPWQTRTKSGKDYRHRTSWASSDVASRWTTVNRSECSTICCFANRYIHEPAHVARTTATLVNIDQTTYVVSRCIPMLTLRGPYQATRTTLGRLGRHPTAVSLGFADRF